VRIRVEAVSLDSTGIKVHPGGTARISFVLVADGFRLC